MTQTEKTLVPPDGWGDYEKLTPAETEAAKGLLLKHEKLKDRLVELSMAMENSVEMLREVCRELRKADFNPVERRTVLRFAGWNKSRISEIGRIVDADNKTFERYMTKAIGFQLALAEARTRTGGATQGTFLQVGEPDTVKELRGYLESYKGRVPTKGAVRLNFVKGGLSFKLVVRTIRKKKRTKKEK